MKQQPPVGHLAARDSAPTLSDRDLRVLECLASGHSTAQIAAVLSVSSNTARTKIRRIQGKLDVTDRAATVRTAEDLGILGIPRPRRHVD